MLQTHQRYPPDWLLRLVIRREEWEREGGEGGWERREGGEGGQRGGKEEEGEEGGRVKERVKGRCTWEDGDRGGRKRRRKRRREGGERNGVERGRKGEGIPFALGL